MQIETKSEYFFLKLNLNTFNFVETKNIFNSFKKTYLIK